MTIIHELLTTLFFVVMSDLATEQENLLLGKQSRGDRVAGQIVIAVIDLLALFSGVLLAYHVAQL